MGTPVGCAGAGALVVRSSPASVLVMSPWLSHPGADTIGPNDNIRNNQAMAPHRVVVLALDRVVPFDLGIAARIFGAAYDKHGRALYDVSTCSIGGRSVSTSADFSIVVDHDEQALASADTVVIATQEPEGRLLEAGELDGSIAAALTLVGDRTRLVTICTGSFVLAATGLLDGLAATTHWSYVRTFARLFPRVELLPDVLFVDNGRLLTSAGGAAGIDLCLYLLRRDHGVDIANAVARRCVVPPWRDGGQAQYIEHPVPDEAGTSTSATRQWVLGHLQHPLALRDLARHAQMSVRTFTRRFHQETGLSPGQWITKRRVDRARTLLETTEVGVEDVATTAGFGSGTLLRQHFKTAVGISPLAYRRSFQAPEPEAARRHTVSGMTEATGS